MTATRNQRALAGEPLADGDTAQHSPRTQERLAAVQAAELQLVAEDKKYHASTFAAEVVVYGTGKKFAAVGHTPLSCASPGTLAAASLGVRPNG